LRLPAEVQKRLFVPDAYSEMWPKGTAPASLMFLPS